MKAPDPFDRFLNPAVVTSVAVILLMANAVGQNQTPRRGGPPDLPEAVTSFGAAVLGEHLYVYSGHTGKAHDHSRENYSEGFYRVNLHWSGDWEKLEMQDPAQGLALVPWNGAVYRVGGVYSRNAPEEAEDMHSTDTFAKYDPESGKWTSLTPLPKPVSSLDAAVLNGKIYVIGGWQLAGEPDDAEWATQYYMADLSADPIQWEALPEAPFTHRALAVATTENFVYAIGGMDEDDSTTREVFIYDPKGKSWSQGPDLPEEGRLKGFGASAFGVEKTVWASARSGRVYALTEGADAWRDTGYDLEKPRFFHRLVPDHMGNLLFIGGTGKGGYEPSIERADLTMLQAEVAAAKPKDEGKNAADLKGQASWTGFRGAGESHSEARNLPLRWSDDENLAWSLELAGIGQSSPVVWKDRVFVTSVEGEQKETNRIICIALENGEKLWEKEFEASQKIKSSQYVSLAAPTPVVDENHLYAFFESGDVIALSHDGEEKWARSLTGEYGNFGGNHGVGSSPALSSAGLIILVEHDGPSYLLCLDPKTGENIWKQDREKRVSWSSPIVTGSGEDEQILISSNGVAESYDAKTGAQNWVVEGISDNTVASPSTDGKVVIVGSSGKRQSQAIRLGGHGNITESHIAWVAEDASSSFGSPLVHDGSVYFVNKAGVAFCNDLETGKLNWSLRLPASCWASPIANGDRIYFFSTNGVTTILQANPEEPVELGTNSLSTESRIYGVSAVDENLIFRMESRVVCVRE